jgi:hypothetical protein
MSTLDPKLQQQLGRLLEKEANRVEQENFDWWAGMVIGGAVNNEKHQKKVQRESTEEFCKRLGIRRVKEKVGREFALAVFTP